MTIILIFLLIINHLIYILELAVIIYVEFIEYIYQRNKLIN